jgi:hypothetical protein
VHLGEMIALARSTMARAWDPAARRMVARGFPHFRVLQVGDRYARVTDASLTGVRLAESARAVKVKQQTLKPGAQVRMIGGLLDGLLGKVKPSAGGCPGALSRLAYAAGDSASSRRGEIMKTRLPH